MSVTTISPPTVPTAQASHPAHRAHSKGGSTTGASASSTQSAANAKANESLEQLAAEGDPTAIAELKAEQPQAPSAGHEAKAPSTGPRTGASEPGKGEEVDVYV